MKKKNDILTDKEKNFCYNYLQTFNVYQSALKVGYSESYAKTHIYNLLEKPKIKKFLNKLREEREKEMLISEQRILNRHLQIAFSNIMDFINNDGTLKEDIDGSLIKKIMIRNTKNETDGNNRENQTISIELEDRKESLKFLTKYFGLDKGKDGDDVIVLD